MKKLLSVLLFTALGVAVSAVDAANDIILSQRKADNSGFIQRNLAPTANAALGVDTNKVPIALSAFTQDSVTGAVGVAASGSNQNITLTPSGTGYLVTPSKTLIGTQGTAGTFGGLLNLGGTSGVQINLARTSADSSGSIISFYKDRSAGAITQSGDELGYLDFRGSYGGSLFNRAALMIAYVDGAPSGTSVPGRFEWVTTPVGGSATSRMSLNSDGSLRFPSTNTSGLQLYNTADQTTNYERLEAVWQTNRGRIRTTFGGSGSLRGLELAAGSASTLLLQNSPTGGYFAFDAVSNSTANSIIAYFAGTSTATSGTNVGLRITPTYNQASGTAANTDLLVNRTQTAVGSGAQLLADFQVGGVSMLDITNAGRLTAAAEIRAGANSGFVVTGRSRFASSSDGIVLLSNNASSDFGRLQFGGTTSAFPALKRSTTTLQVRLADDSADAGLTAAGATLSGALITTPQALSGAGAVNVTTSATFYTSTGGAQALTLADGTAEGQIKTIVHKVDGGSGVLTPTTKIGYTTITFTNVGDSCTLQWTSVGWAIVGIFGAVAA